MCSSSRVRVAWAPHGTHEAEPGRFGGQVSVLDIYHIIPYHHTGIGRDTVHVTGTLHRAMTGAGGSTHVTIGFPRDGISWSDLVLNGFQTGAAESLAFWSEGAPGSNRARTHIQPGNCPGGVQCTYSLAHAHGGMLFQSSHHLLFV